MNRFSRQGLSQSLNFLVECPWIAYTGIVLLQVKVMFRIWEFRDLAPGDTSYYYLTVFNWLDEGKGNIAQSPLYTLFLAGLHKLLDEPFWVLTTARIGIATGASLLTLALLRRLLPKHIAWMIAAWWVLLSINFDTAYSVHLFSALFPLGLFVVATRADNLLGRGMVLAGLLLTAVLVRNEYAALFILWLLVLPGYEFYLRRWKGRRPPLKNYLVAYGLPLLVVFLIIGVFYVRARPGGLPEIEKELAMKQAGNMCQIYAFNRLQQGDPWRGNPWNQCEELLQRDFGRSEVSFPQAFFLNPRAILQHVWWNARLIPNGTQLALFDFYSGGPNPDYMPAKKSPLVWIPFFLVAGLAGFAAIRCLAIPALRRGRSVDNGFAWLLMASAGALVLGLMLMQRPRPSYMFPCTVFIMALTGLGLHGLIEFLHITKPFRILVPIFGISLILFVPSHYNASYVNYYGYEGQPLLKSFERISPHIDSSSESPMVIVTPRGDESLCNYLDEESCTAIQYKKIAGPNLGYYVKSLGVNWIYLRGLKGREIKYDEQQWELVAQGTSKKGRWILLHRQAPD